MRKNRFFVLGMLALIFATGSLLVGCSDSDDGGGGGATFPAEFIGEWDSDANNDWLEIFNEDDYSHINHRFAGGGGLDFFLENYSHSGNNYTMVFTPAFKVDTDKYQVIISGNTLSIALIKIGKPPALPG